MVAKSQTACQIWLVQLGTATGLVVGLDSSHMYLFLAKTMTLTSVPQSEVACYWRPVIVSSW